MGGGSAANTACWLASLGTPVRLVAAVGATSSAGSRWPRSRSSVWCSPGRSSRRLATGSCVVLIDGDRRAHDAPRPRGERGRWPRRWWRPRSTATSPGCTSRATRSSAPDPIRPRRRPWRPLGGSACRGRSTPPAPRPFGPLARTGSCAGSRVAPCCSPTTTSSAPWAAPAGALRCAGEVVVKLGPAGRVVDRRHPLRVVARRARHGGGHHRRRRRLRCRLPRRPPRRRRPRRVAPRGRPRRRPGGEPARCPSLGRRFRP